MDRTPTVLVSQYMLNVPYNPRVGLGALMPIRCGGYRCTAESAFINIGYDPSWAAG